MTRADHVIDADGHIREPVESSIAVLAGGALGFYGLS